MSYTRRLNKVNEFKGVLVSTKSNKVNNKFVQSTPCERRNVYEKSQGGPRDPTLNREAGYELPEIYWDVLSKDFFSLDNSNQTNFLFPEGSRTQN